MKKMRVCSGGEAPRDGEDQDGGSSDVESSGSGEITDAAEPEEDHDEETGGTSRETMSQTLRVVPAPQKLMVRFQPNQHHW